MVEVALFLKGQLNEFDTAVSTPFLVEVALFLKGQLNDYFSRIVLIICNRFVVELLKQVDFYSKFAVENLVSKNALEKIISGVGL